MEVDRCVQVSAKINCYLDPSEAQVQHMSKQTKMHQVNKIMTGGNSVHIFRSAQWKISQNQRFINKLIIHGIQKTRVFAQSLEKRSFVSQRRSNEQLFQGRPAGHQRTRCVTRIPIVAGDQSPKPKWHRGQSCFTCTHFRRHTSWYRCWHGVIFTRRFAGSSSTKQIGQHSSSVPRNRSASTSARRMMMRPADRRLRSVARPLRASDHTLK